ncbi:integral membrane protein [Leucobacter sp. 7(1)]|uniref:ABC transporter permease n=1 Tax=Leucobacter sp. 7(1) TaxID=1255613 RepID=UPI00097EC29D|nr:ABC transporter permease [Leucobacter sp. 7(1)]SJN13188.1 integral membrane protein [Leucobacter sp. 7(1)]
MTSTILIDASSAPTTVSGSARPRAAAAHVPAQSFGGVFRSERIKFTSLLSTRVTLLITVLMGLGVSTLVVLMQVNGQLIVGGPDALFGSGTTALQNYLLFASTLSAPFLALVFGVLGVFAISNEYSSGMILSTLTAVPRRGRVFGAKALLLAVASGLTAAVLVLGGLGIAMLALPEAARVLFTVPVVSGVLGTIAYLVLISLFAFGVAAILRSTAGGIAVVAGITFVLQIVFQVISMTGWEWVGVAAAYLPTPLGGTLSMGLTDMPADPGYWTALLAMGLWAAVALIPAAILFQRRDAR